MSLTPRSSPSSDTLAERFVDTKRFAIFDELEKIAEGAQAPKKTPQWKRALTTAGKYALGYTAGHGAGMLIDKGLAVALKDKYPRWKPSTKHTLLYPLLGAASVGIMAGANYAASQRKKAMEEDA